MQRSWPHWPALIVLLLFQTLGVFASSLKTSYTLAYAPVGATSSKPTAFAVLVSQPATATPPSEKPKPKTTRQSKSAGVASKQPPIDLGPWFDFESYTLPKKESASRAQIGILTNSGKDFNGSTTLASLAALQDPLVSTLYVQLSPEGEAQSISLREVQSEASSRTGTEKRKKNTVAPVIELLHAAPEPKPVLNKPVVLNAEGKVDEEPQEKTLLQRYWWVGLIVLGLTFMGGESK